MPLVKPNTLGSMPIQKYDLVSPMRAGRQDALSQQKFELSQKREEEMSSLREQQLTSMKFQNEVAPSLYQDKRDANALALKAGQRSFDSQPTVEQAQQRNANQLEKDKLDIARTEGSIAAQEIELQTRQMSNWSTIQDNFKNMGLTVQKLVDAGNLPLAESFTKILENSLDYARSTANDLGQSYSGLVEMVVQAQRSTSPEGIAESHQNKVDAATRGAELNWIQKTDTLSALYGGAEPKPGKATPAQIAQQKKAIEWDNLFGSLMQSTANGDIGLQSSFDSIRKPDTRAQFMMDQFLGTDGTPKHLTSFADGLAASDTSDYLSKIVKSVRGSQNLADHQELARYNTWYNKKFTRGYSRALNKAFINMKQVKGAKEGDPKEWKGYNPKAVDLAIDDSLWLDFQRLNDQRTKKYVNAQGLADYSKTTKLLLALKYGADTEGRDAYTQLFIDNAKEQYINGQ